MFRLAALGTSSVQGERERKSAKKRQPPSLPCSGAGSKRQELPPKAEDLRSPTGRAGCGGQVWGLLRGQRSRLQPWHQLQGGGSEAGLLRAIKTQSYTLTGGVVYIQKLFPWRETSAGTCSPAKPGRPTKLRLHEPHSHQHVWRHHVPPVWPHLGPWMAHLEQGVADRVGLLPS